MAAVAVAPLIILGRANQRATKKLSLVGISMDSLANLTNRPADHLLVRFLS